MAVPSEIIPSLRALFVFEAAARTGRFTAAAREFNVTQPSISRNVAQLERDLGIALFDRRPSGLELTAEGRELFAAVQTGIGSIVETIGNLQERQRRRMSEVTMSLSSSFVAHWLVPKLGAFNAAFHEVDLRFELISGVMFDTVPDSADLATRIVPDGADRYHCWDFAPEIVVPVCSPSYLLAHGPLDHEGTGEGHVFLHLSGHGMREWGSVWGQVADPTRGRGAWHVFSDYAVILQAAINGDGIALGWLSVVSGALLKGTLVPASARRIDTGRLHRLIAPRSRPLRPVVIDIAKWLSDRMAEELRPLRPLLHC